MQHIVWHTLTSLVTNNILLFCNTIYSFIHALKNSLNFEFQQPGYVKFLKNIFQYNYVVNTDFYINSIFIVTIKFCML